MRRACALGRSLLARDAASTSPLLLVDAASCAATPPRAARWAVPSLARGRAAQPRPQAAEDPPPVSEASRLAWRASLPSAAEVAARLRSGAAASCLAPAPAAAAAAPAAENDSELDWREAVARARALEAAPSAAGAAPRPALTDTFGRAHSYLRISLTERCNLRCTYCMPAEGVELTPAAGLLTTPEILRLARLFAAEGVTKIRLTGGEPTLRRDLEVLVAALAAIPGVRDVGMTSNGLVLAKRLPALRAAGLSLLNLSLDTLRPERFERLARRRGHAHVLAALAAAAAAGFDPVKLNVVVMRGVNDDEAADFAALTRDAPVNVRFIEYMPFDGNVWSSDKLVPYAEVKARVEATHGPLARLPAPPGEVARNYALAGHRGSVSFVASMTRAFCGDCNRLRLMADGALKVCLFGAGEVSLRRAMREGATDAELRAVVGAAVGRKRAAHAGMFELARAPNRAMVKIGG
jgi:cyclic pyranopterin phosphate synthase